MCLSLDLGRNLHVYNIIHALCPVRNSYNSIIYREGRDKFSGKGVDISWMYMHPEFNTDKNL